MLLFVSYLSPRYVSISRDTTKHATRHTTNTWWHMDLHPIEAITQTQGWGTSDTTSREETQVLCMPSWPLHLRFRGHAKGVHRSCQHPTNAINANSSRWLWETWLRSWLWSLAKAASSSNHEAMIQNNDFHYERNAHKLFHDRTHKLHCYSSI